jgi:hypothetical protein
MLAFAVIPRSWLNAKQSLCVSACSYHSAHIPLSEVRRSLILHFFLTGNQYQQLTESECLLRFWFFFLNSLLVFILDSIQECHLEYSLFVLEVHFYQEVILVLELLHHSCIHVNQQSGKIEHC